MEIRVEGDAIECEIGDFLTGFMEADRSLRSVTVIHTADDELFPVCHRGRIGRGGGEIPRGEPIRKMSDEERAWVLSLMREADLVACNMTPAPEGRFSLRMVKRMRPDGEKAR